MAAPIPVTFGTIGGTTATSHSTAYPATTAGDYLVLFMGLDKGSATATTINTPTGFIAASAQGTAGLTAYNIGRAFYRLCDGTETGSFTTSYSSSSLAGGVWMLVRGADAFANWLVALTTYQVGTDNKLDPLVSSSVNATTAEGLLLGIVSWDESKTLSAAPSGFTAFGHLDVSGLDVRGDYKTLSASGATGTISWDISSATRYNAVTIWIPATAGGAVVYNQAVAAFSSSAVTLPRAMAKAVATAAPTVVTVKRAMALRIMAAVASTTLVNAIRAYLVAIQIGAASSVTLAKRAGKALLAGCTGAVLAAKRIVKATVLQSLASVRVAKGLGKVIQPSILTATAVAIGRAFRVTVAASITAAASMRKSVTRVVRPASQAAVSLSKAVSITARASLASMVEVLLAASGGAFEFGLRIVRLAAEVRRTLLGQSSRSVVVSAQASRVQVSTENRTAVVPSMSRLGTVPAMNRSERLDEQ